MWLLFVLERMGSVFRSWLHNILNTPRIKALETKNEIHVDDHFHNRGAICSLSSPIHSATNPHVQRTLRPIPPEPLNLPRLALNKRNLPLVVCLPSSYYCIISISTQYGLLSREIYLREE